MEKLLNPYDKENMRMAMLKHEETFKQQVYELHRLYQVQKILMKSIKIEKQPKESSQEVWSLKKNNIRNGFIRKVDRRDTQQNSRMELDLDRLNHISGSNIETIDEGEIELTLGPSCYSRRSKKKLPETPLNSDSVPSFSSSSTCSSNNNKRVNAVIAAREESRSVDLEEDLRQERLKRQPWLYQVLSLNIT